MKLSVILSNVPTKHPLRVIRTISDDVLEKFATEIGETQADYTSRDGPPAKCLLRAQLLRAIYSIRTEQQLLDQLDFNVLFRWFVGLPMDADVWDIATFADGCARLIDSGIAFKVFEAVIRQPRASRLLSGDLFSVDGSLIGGAPAKSAKAEFTFKRPSPPAMTLGA